MLCVCMCLRKKNKRIIWKKSPFILTFVMEEANCTKPVEVYAS